MRRLVALIANLPGDSATALVALRRPEPVRNRHRETSSPDAIRRAGGKFVYAPRGGD